MVKGLTERIINVAFRFSFVNGENFVLKNVSG